MKCLEKDRSRRYETANGLALEIQRYLADEPVDAGPPSARYRLRKFVQRNQRGLLTAAFVGVILLAAVGAVAGTLGWAARDRTVRQATLAEKVQLALEDAQTLGDRALTFVDGNPYQWEATLAAALSAVKRAEGLAEPEKESLDSALVERLAALKERLEADDKNRQFVSRFEAIRLESSELDAHGGHDNLRKLPGKIKALFEAHGATVGRMSPEEFVAWLQRRPAPIQKHMVAALFQSLARTPTASGEERKSFKALLSAACRLDGDPQKSRLLHVLFTGDHNALENLVRDLKVERHGPAFLIVVADLLPSKMQATRLGLLERTQRAFPGDFWANFDYGYALTLADPAQPGDAVRYSQAALALRPRNPWVHLRLGYALGKKGDTDAAIAAYRRALVLEPKFAMAHNNLGFALLDKGDHDTAIAEFCWLIDFVAFDPTNHRPFVGLSLAVRSKAHQDTLIAAYRKGIAAAGLDPRAAWLYPALARALCDQGDFDGSRRVHANLLEKFGKCKEPEVVKAFTGLGTMSLWGIRDVPSAMASFRTALELDPGDAHANSGLGSCLEQSGDLDGAIAAYRKVLVRDPYHAPARNYLVRCLGKKGTLDTAIDAHRKTLALDPANLSSYICLGDLLSARGNLEGAIAAFQSAIKLKPENLLLYYSLGEALRKNRDMDGALGVYKKILELDARNADAHLHIGDYLRGKGDLDGAIAAYRKALEKIATSDTCTRLGAVLQSKGDVDGAIAAYRKALQWKANDPVALDGLAALLKKKGGPKAVIATFRQLSELYPNNAEVHHTLGRALHEDQNFDGAVRAYRKAIEVFRIGEYRFSHGFLLLPLGKALLHQKYDSPDKISAYRKAVEVYPQMPETHISLGYALADKGDFAAAVAAFRQAGDLKPDDFIHYYYLACAYLAAGDRDAHRHVCAEMLDRFGKTREASVAAVIVWSCVPAADTVTDMPRLMALAELAATRPEYARDLGAVLYRAGKYRAAIDALKRGELRPRHHLFLAMAHHHAGEPEKANEYIQLATSSMKATVLAWPERVEAEHLRREAEALIASRLEPTTALIRQGDALRLKRDWTGAIAAYKEAIDLDPKQRDAYLGLGHSLQGKGDRTGAAAAFRKVLELDPRHVIAQASLGDALSGLGDLAGATSSYRKVIELAPGHFQAHANLALVRQRQGDWEQAEAGYRRTITLVPNWSYPHGQLGYVLCHKQDWAGGIRALRKALELNPTDTMVAYWLADAWLASGERDAHRECCADLMKRHGKTKLPVVAGRVLAVCVPVSDALADMKELVPLAQTAQVLKFNVPLLGAALYRAGQYQAALKPLSEGQPRAWNQLFLAMAYHRLGQADKAREYLELATKHKTAASPWPERIEVDLLRREAELLITGTGNEPTPPK
jgi:tetratricopeptide (TPR) repeat protein